MNVSFARPSDQPQHILSGNVVSGGIVRIDHGQTADILILKKVYQIVSRIGKVIIIRIIWNNFV